MASRLRLIARLQRISLRAKLTLCFAGLTVAVFAAVLAAALHGANASNNAFSKQLVTHITAQTSAATTEYTHEASIVAGAVIASLNANPRLATDAKALERYLVEATDVSQLARYIYVADDSGQFVGVERAVGAQEELFARIRPASETVMREYKLTNEGARLPQPPTKSFAYDPRLRPWYLRVKAEGKPIWTEPYKSASRGHLVVTYAKPLFSLDGKVVGAVGIDFSLARLAQFYKSLKPSENGVAYLFTPTGALLAQSDDTVLSEPEIGALWAMAGGAVGAPLLEVPSMSAADRISTALVPFGERSATVVVRTPQRDLLAGTLPFLLRALALSVIATAAAIFLGTLVLRSVIRDLSTLSKSARDVARGMTMTRLPTERQDELGDLARSFQHMRTQVFRELTDSRSMLAHSDLITEFQRHAITEKDTALRAARLHSARLAAAVESAHEPIAILSSAQILTYVNSAFVALVGRPAQSLIGAPIAVLATSPEDLLDFEELLARAISQREVVRKTLHVRVSGKRVMYFDVVLSPIITDEVVREVTLICRDVTGVVADQNALSRAARIDPATKLWRREAALEQLAELIQLQPLQPISVLFIDLDGFKAVNDQHGHSMGDRALRFVAQLIREHTRERDIACRFGGDEFMIATVGENSSDVALAIAERLIPGIAAVSITLGINNPITASIGLASFPADASTLDGVVRNADQAMYRAKDAGGNRCIAWANTKYKTSLRVAD